MHSLLKRQLKRCFGDSFSVPQEWQALISAVNDAYRESDSDRKMLERSLDLSSQELLQANSEMRAVFKAIPDLMFRLDSEGTILDFTAGGTSDFLLEPKQFIGKRVQDVPLAEIGGEFNEAVNQLLETNSMVSIEYCLMIQNEKHCYEARLLPLFEKQIMVIIRNITERKETEEALKDSEQRLKNIVQGSPIPTFVIGKDHRVIHWNKALEELTGTNAAEVVGTNRHWAAFYPAERPCMADLLVDKDIEAVSRWYADKHSSSRLLDEAFEATDFFPELGKQGKWLHFTAATIKDSRGHLVGAITTLQDITERKQAEEALISANQQLNDIIEFLPDATFVIDKDKRVIAWNRAIEEMTGVSKTDMIGQGDYAVCVPFYGERRPHLLDLLDVSDPELESRYQNLIRKGNILYSETFVPCVYHGKGAYVFATGAPLFDAHGNRVGAIESIRDITERKLAEEALKESQQRLADIINFLPDATLVIDKEGRVIAWNKAIEEMTGVKAEDMLGKGSYEYAVPFYGERRPILIDLVLKPQEEIEARYVIAERKDTVLAGEAYMPALRGGEVYLFGTASILRDSRGHIVGAIESIRDITERKRVEEALARAEEKYRSIFENAIEGIYQTTVEGRFISVNPAFARMLGYDSPDEILNTITDIPRQLYVNPEGRFELLQVIEERGVVQEFETQFLRKDKSIAWVALNVRAVLDKGGEVSYLEGTAQDITDRKTLESRLFRAQKMEAIGTLAGGIAHDFNNILAAVIGYTEMTKGRLQQAELRGNLEQVLKACDRAKNLVGQILTFSRSVELEIRPIDIAPLTNEALKLLRATLPSTIEIRQIVAPDARAVLADPTQIHQVLINLCTNAAHAMRERGGILEVRLENVDTTSEITGFHSDLTSGSYVRLAVTDTGTGIPPEVVHRIFDPFFTTKKPGEGTGLGLSVVYGIVSGYGGTITVHSKPGTGSAFTVYLPAIACEATAEEEPLNAIPRGKERILFVDDEDILAEMGRDLLEDLGYTVTAMTDSLSAWDVFRAQPDQFDLVITDMTMPGMTGAELAKELLKIRPKIPIILCTGYSEFITEEKAKKIGIQGFAFKPLTIKILTQLISQVLRVRSCNMT
jgi:PAS domain S-box-containing protein